MPCFEYIILISMYNVCNAIFLFYPLFIKTINIAYIISLNYINLGLPWDYWGILIIENNAFLIEYNSEPILK